MRVAIIGGGISGLSAYLNLHKSLVRDPRLKASISITIYETYDLTHLGETKPSEIPSHGGGYGIAPNGMAANAAAKSETFSNSPSCLSSSEMSIWDRISSPM